MRREPNASARPRTAPLAAAFVLLGLALPAPWGPAPTPAGGLWAALGAGGTARAQRRGGTFAPISSRTRVSGPITADTIWRRSRSPYLVTATVTVGGGATLTIQPGVEVRFAAGAGLHIGVETPGALIAVGTATQRIRFTSAATTKVAGGWGAVALSSKTRRSSRVRHAVVAYSRSGISLDGVPEGVSVSDTSIQDTSQDGIFIGSRGSAAVMTRMSVSRAGGYALNAPQARDFRISRSRLGGRLNAPRADRAVWGPGNTLTDFGAWAACVHPVLVEAVANSVSGAVQILVKGGTLIKSASWPARTYRMLGTLNVASSVTPVLTLAPGSTLRFASGAGLYVGLTPAGGGNPGGLVAVGTAAAPIRFTADAAEPTAGAWDGLRLYTKTLATSRLEHVTIEYTVRGLWLFTVPAGISFKHATLRHSSGAGVEIAGGNPTFEHFTISDVGSGNFTLSSLEPEFTLRNSTLRGPFYALNAASAVLENNTYYTQEKSVLHPNLVAAVAAGVAGATAQTVIPVSAGTLWKSGTWPARTYRVLGELVVGGEASPVLTLAAGATLRCTHGVSVGRYQPAGIVAVGTAAAPIVFTANRAQPVPGRWGGLSLYGKALATSRLEHVTLEYGGGLLLVGAPPGVRYRHIAIRHTAGNGVGIVSGNPFFEHLTVSPVVGVTSHPFWTAGPTFSLRHATLHGSLHAANATAFTLADSTVHGGLHAPLAAGGVLENSTVRDSAASLVHPNLVAAVATGTPGATAETVLGVAGGTLSKSASWPARTYRLRGVTVAGSASPVLTLAAGTTLRMPGATAIDIGQRGFGGLIAAGTAAAPIRFTADADPPRPGAWWGISLHGNTLPSSRLEHVTIEYSVWGLRLSSVPPGVRLRHGVIRHVAQHGVRIFAGIASFDTWAISHTGDGPAYFAFSTLGTAFALRNSILRGSLHAPNAAEAVLENNTYQASARSQLHPNLVGAVAAGTIGATAKTVIPVVVGTLSKSATWPARTYRLRGLAVEGSASPVLTLAPGSTLRFASGGLDVGNLQAGGLIAVGTAEAPIRFTADAAEPAAGAWNGIRLLGQTLGTTQLAHVTVEYAWHGLRLVDSPSGIVLRDGTVRHVSGDGISVQRASPTLVRWTLSGVARYGIISSIGSPQISHLTVTGAGPTGVHFNGSSGSVSHSTITGSRGHGVYCHGGRSGRIELFNNRITGNTGSGVYGFAAIHIEDNIITGNAVGIELAAAPALLAIHHNDLSANTVPIKSTATAGADARWNWWGSVAGPSGVVGPVRTDPWLGAAPTAPFRIEDAVASPRRFAPGGTASVATLTARTPQAASWSLVLRDGEGTTVRSFTATGTSFSQDWDGANAQSAALAAGSYRYTLSARRSAEGGTAAAPVVGDLALVAGDLVAEIASPVPEARLRRSASLVVRGRALGTGFSAYELDFAAGPDPRANSFIRIARGTAAVANAAALGTWNTALLSEGIYTLRLRTLGAGDAAAEERVIVSLLTLGAVAVSPGHFSPNGDGRLDEVAARATALSRGPWTAQVRSAAGVVLRSYAGTGSIPRIVWDGRNAAGVTQPDGTYTLALRMTVPGATPLEKTGTVVLDATAPTAAITAPSDVLDYEETVTGTASDLHFSRYELRTAGGGQTVGVLKQSTTAVVAGTLGTLTDGVFSPRYQDGTPYNLELEVEDRAGNRATATRVLRFDRIHLFGIQISPRSIDPEQDKTTRISYRLNRPAAVTVRLVAATPADEGGTTYTLVDNQNLSRGLLTTTWNGKSAAGKPAARGLYHLHIAARDAAGRSAVYDGSAAPLGQVVPFWSDVRFNGKVTLAEAGFDPYRNDELQVNYQMSQVARHSVVVRPEGKPELLLRDRVPVPAGANRLAWTGRLADGKPYTGPFTVYFGAPEAVSELSLVVSSPPFRVESFRTNPYLFRPAHAEVVHISYTLARAAQVRIDVVDPEGNHWLRLQEPTAQTPGPYTLEWSGRDSAGKIASPDGLYTIEVTATETGGRGDRTVRRGNLLVYQ